MAKIGNEAKLILKLAKERAATELSNSVSPRTSSNASWALAFSAYAVGYGIAYHDWLTTLDQVVTEIEGGKEKKMETKQYKIEGRDNSGNWDESLVGNDTEANTFDSIAEAAAMIPGLIRSFRDDDPPPTTDDFRVVERN